MGKLTKNSHGFGTIEIVIGISIMVVIVLVGTIVLSQKRTATISRTNNSGNPNGTSANPYAGWKIGTLKFEQITFQYPSDWTLTGSSVAGTSGDGYTPGIDNFAVSSQSNNSATLITGTGGMGAATVLDSLTTKVFNNTYNLIVFGLGSEASQASYACVETQQNAPFNYIPDKNIVASSASSTVQSGQPLNNAFCYYASQPTLLTAFESSPNFATAKLIFQSMKYY